MSRTADGCVNLLLNGSWIVESCDEPRVPICEMSFTVVDPKGDIKVFFMHLELSLYEIGFTTSETSQMSDKQGLIMDYVKFWLVYVYQPMAAIPLQVSKCLLLSLDAVHFVLHLLFEYFRRRGLYGMFL